MSVVALDTTEKFSHEEYAIFRHVWSLGAERSKLDSFFIMRTTIANAVSRFDKSSHSYKVLLHYKNIAYEVECMDCSIHYLENVPELTAGKIPLLMSMRYSAAKRMAICLLKLPHKREWGNISMSRFEEFK